MASSLLYQVEVTEDLVGFAQVIENPSLDLNLEAHFHQDLDLTSSKDPESEPEPEQVTQNREQFQDQLNPNPSSSNSSLNPTGLKINTESSELELENLDMSGHPLCHPPPQHHLRGTYVCGGCNNELFSSKDEIKNQNKSDLHFSNMIRKGALHRSRSSSQADSESDSLNSIQVACAKCSHPVGREIMEVSSEGQIIGTSYFSVTQNALRFVKGKKKS